MLTMPAMWIFYSLRWTWKRAKALPNERLNRCMSYAQQPTKRKNEVRRDNKKKAFEQLSASDECVTKCSQPSHGSVSISNGHFTKSVHCARESFQFAAISLKRAEKLYTHAQKQTHGDDLQWKFNYVAIVFIGHIFAWIRWMIRSQKKKKIHTQELMLIFVIKGICMNILAPEKWCENWIWKERPCFWPTIVFHA